MLIKETNAGWSKKINFIDRNDNFVGYDWSGQCCESFGYYFATEVTEHGPSHQPEHEGFYFDTSVSAIDVEYTGEYTDEDAGVAFKCINDAGAVIYLHLTNSHNGYYSHGWESSFAGEGSL